ncbi:MAG: FHA domain-containing protein [Ahrensia sp.]
MANVIIKNKILNTLALGARKARGICIATIVAVGVFAGNSSSAVAQGMETNCQVDSTASPRSVGCDFRLQSLTQPEDVNLTVNGTRLADPAFEPFAASGKASAWLYLIDTSNPRRAATVKANAEFVRSQMTLTSQNRLAGVATFASEMVSVLPIAPTHVNRDARINAIIADGVATEFFANSLAAIEMLNDVEADRKALVIMSDGKAEDTAYSLDDVVAAAREAGVIIIGLGYAESATETPSLQSIRRLAEETGGAFRSVVSGSDLPDDFVSNMQRFLENGGTVSAPLPEALSGDVAVQVEVELRNGTTINAEQTVAVESAPAEIQEDPQTLAGQIFGMFDGMFPGASDWADTNGGLALALLALPLALLIGLIVFLMNRRDQSAPEEVGDVVIEDEFETTTIFDSAETDISTRAIKPASSGEFGYFEVVGNEAVKYPLDRQSVSVGRHSDNDIQLSNDSVHRHHAHVHISNTGSVTIKDLDTTNGVLVNGRKMGSAELQTGDMIELGEVRLRYNNN